MSNYTTPTSYNKENDQIIDIWLITSDGRLFIRKQPDDKVIFDSYDLTIQGTSVKDALRDFIDTFEIPIIEEDLEVFEKKTTAISEGVNVDETIFFYHIPKHLEEYLAQLKDWFYIGQFFFPDRIFEQVIKKEKPVAERFRVIVLSFMEALDRRYGLRFQADYSKDFKIV